MFPFASIVKGKIATSVAKSAVTLLIGWAVGAGYLSATSSEGIIAELVPMVITLAGLIATAIQQKTSERKVLEAARVLPTEATLPEIVALSQMPGFTPKPDPPSFAPTPGLGR
jgi:hypothetical protein